jgi:hypothetical protein
MSNLKMKAAIMSRLFSIRQKEILMLILNKYVICNKLEGVKIYEKIPCHLC